MLRKHICWRGREERALAPEWTAEDNFYKLLLSLYHVGLGD